MNATVNFTYFSKPIKIARSFFFFMTFLFILFSFSCSDAGKGEKEKTEIILDSLIYDDNGNLFTGRMKGKVNNKKIEYDVVKGKKDGEFRLYHENGVLEIEGQISNNKNFGLWKYYYKNGGLESEGYFKDDLLEWKWSWYYPSGQLKETAEYENSVRNGSTVSYDENGDIIFEKKFNEGKEFTE